MQNRGPKRNPVQVAINHLDRGQGGITATVPCARQEGRDYTVPTGDAEAL